MDKGAVVSPLIHSTKLMLQSLTIDIGGRERGRKREREREREGEGERYGRHPTKNVIFSVRSGNTFLRSFAVVCYTKALWQRYACFLLPARRSTSLLGPCNPHFFVNLLSKQLLVLNIYIKIINYDYN
jgi:hypothetical protein